MQRELGNVQAICHVLGLIGEVALALSSPVPAARLWGQVQRLGEEFGWSLTPVPYARRERAIATARVALGEEAFEVAWNEGRAMVLDQAVDYALNVGRVSPARDLL